MPSVGSALVAMVSTKGGGLRRPLTSGALILALIGGVMAACGGDDDLGGDPMAADPAVILPAAAEAMGSVESVRFELERGGAPVFIDEVDSLAFDKAIGRVEVPGRADALLDVTVNGNLATQLGAVAFDGDTWLSNPITGDFEPLPAGYDIDPTLFFDPKGGWQPLIEGLQDVTFLGTEDKDGQRYHLRGTGPADQLEVVTARLVRNQDVVIDFWVHPVTGLVTAVEFDTDDDGAVSSWSLRLADYGERFDIEPPDLDG